MTSTGTIRTIVGIIGNVISFFLFLSPVPTFWKIIKAKEVQEFKPDPYVATVLNCAMWCFYGMPFVKPDSTLVITINGIGLAIELTYVAIFFIYAHQKMRKKILLALLIEVIFMLIIIIITMLAFHSNRSTFVGILCIIFNIIMYASPLTVMKTVIQTKSVKYMPFYLSLANFFNGIIWVIYASLKFDINIVLPNALGTLSGAIQLMLFAIYYKSTNWDDTESDHKPEVQMSSSSMV